jgi:hypothetical protein
VHEPQLSADGYPPAALPAPTSARRTSNVAPRPESEPPKPARWLHARFGASTRHAREAIRQIGSAHGMPCRGASRLGTNGNAPERLRALPVRELPQQ